MCSGYFKKRNNRYFLKKAKNGLLGFFSQAENVSWHVQKGPVQTNREHNMLAQHHQTLLG